MRTSGPTRPPTRSRTRGRPRRKLLLGEVSRGERVLDLGCGDGHFLRALREAGADPVGVEIAEAAVQRARENVPGADVRLIEPDGSLPLGHNEVDLIWCSEVLEHIPDVGHALLEMRRVLKRGGRALITVPYHGRVYAMRSRCRFERHFDPLGQHVRFFTRRSLHDAQPRGLRAGARVPQGRCSSRGPSGPRPPPAARDATTTSLMLCADCGSR